MSALDEGPIETHHHLLPLQARENAIMIYGPRKAGTTLLQRLVDGSSLYVYPTELKVKQLSKATWTDKASFVEECQRTDRLMRDHVEGFDHHSFEQVTRHAAYQACSLRDAILSKVSAAIKCSPGGDWVGWVVKEAGGDFEGILRDWKKMFADSKLVVILRNPFFVSRSVFRKRYRTSKKLTLREVAKEVSHPWQIFKAVSAHLGRKDMHLVYYEDLVVDTEAEMRAVANFLGITFVPRLTYPTMFGEPTVVSTSTRQETAVFQARGRYWKGLGVKEIALLTLMGGAYCLMNLLTGTVTFKNGAIRLVGCPALRG